MTTNLFSTFRQGENRVTSTFMAVLQRLSLPNIDRILQGLLEDSAFSLVTFDNQPTGKKSRPDARIGTGAGIWIETKTARNAVDSIQIKNHLHSLQDHEKLLLLTPDGKPPAELDDKVVWSNFETLAGAIEEILRDENEPPSEKEAFLLREFILMLRKDGLLTSSASTVMVVSARIAWPVYEEFNVYTHAPYNQFHPADRIAFYTNWEIKNFVPKVISVIESIDILNIDEIDSLQGKQKELAHTLHEKVTSRGWEKHPEFATPHKFIFLTHPDDKETVKLERPVVCDKTSKNGRPVPLMYGGQRYVTIESLRKARRTSELEFC